MLSWPSLVCDAPNIADDYFQPLLQIHAAPMFISSNIFHFIFDDSLDRQENREISQGLSALPLILWELDQLEENPLFPLTPPYSQLIKDASSNVFT